MRFKSLVIVYVHPEQYVELLAERAKSIISFSIPIGEYNLAIILTADEFLDTVGWMIPGGIYNNIPSDYRENFKELLKKAGTFILKKENV